MNCGSETCAKICLKKGTVQSKTYIYIWSTFEKDIKELNLTKVCEYLGTEESHDVQHKHEKEELKKEYLRLGLVLGTEVQRIKFKQLHHLQYQYLDTIWNY